MIPAPKIKKTSLQKMLSRSSSSTWVKGGAKKKQRSTQWFFSQIAPSTLLHQFLKEHCQTTDDLRAMLVTYFQNEGALDAYESLYDFQVSRRYRLDIPSPPQEDWLLCGDTDWLPDVIESEDKFEEVEVEDLHLPTEDAVPGHPVAYPDLPWQLSAARHGKSLRRQLHFVNLPAARRAFLSLGPQCCIRASLRSMRLPPA